MKKMIFLPVLFLFVITACSVKKYVQKADIASTIPADFDPNKQIVLLAEIPIQGDPDGDRHEKRTKDLDDTFKKFYKYRYEIVSAKEIEKNSKYKDTTVYKFILLNKYGVYTAQSPARYSSTGVPKQDAYSISRDILNFYFYDRTKAKEYPPVSPANLGRLTGSVQTLIAILDRAQQERRP